MILFFWQLFRESSVVRALCPFVLWGLLADRSFGVLCGLDVRMYVTTNLEAVHGRTASRSFVWVDRFVPWFVRCVCLVYSGDVPS